MFNFDKLKQERDQIEKDLSAPDAVSNMERYTKLSKRFSFLEKILELAQTREGCHREKAHLEEVVANPKEDEQLKILASEELKEIEEKIKRVEKEIEDKIFEEDQPDRDVIIEIRSAAGGDEAALFVGDLFRMYSKYIEKNNWKLEILSSNPTDIKGFKEIIFSARGKGAFMHFKFESGVHRVQRVPVTESGGRIHTSTATVAVLIEPKEVELKINPDDLKIDTFRASGRGGQHVNVTDSAVRITHAPTGVVVSCQDERSQIKNREKAMRVLKARILEKQERDQADKITKQRRTQVGTGERSEKIRTYNFPERRVTDHRINFTLYKLEAVLEGNLDEVVDALISYERKKSYEDKGLA